MSDRRQRLTDLAAALSDGATIDWDAAESTAASDSERRQIRRLRLVREVVDAQHDAAINDAADSAPHESLLHPAGGPRLEGAPVTWGPLRVLEKIGRGRFGDVYRAWDPRLDREVALKLLRHRAQADDLESTVIEEGRLLAKVRHPNVVTVYGAERIDDRAGVWMELVRGRNLEEELQARGPFPADEVARIGTELAGALAAVHRAGLVHRDVKAQNVMRDADGRLVLMDFGTGREVEGDPPFELAGTPLYLAPEVLAGASATPQADLYSLGVLLFHLASGRFPVEAASLSSVRDAHRRGDRHALRSLRPTLPSSLVRAIDRALEPDPAQRHSGPDAFAAALTPGPRTPAWRGWVTRALLALALPAGVVGVWALRSPGEPRPAPAPRTPYRLAAAGPFTPGDLSRDGRLLVGTLPTPNGQDIVLRDVTTGRMTTLVAGTHARYGLNPVFSPDGRFIAYRWAGKTAGGDLGYPSSLQVVAAPPGAASNAVLLASATSIVTPLAWSPDSRALLCLVREPNLDPRQPALNLSWVRVEDGSVTPIRTFEKGRNPDGVRLSPDGRWIAHSSPPDATSAERRIYVMNAADGSEAAVVRMAGFNTDPIWTPDGRRIVFRGSRSGSAALWAVTVEQGAAVGEPERLLPGFTGRPVGASADGVLHFTQASGGETFEFMADLDERSPRGPSLGPRPPAGASARIRQVFPGAGALFSTAGDRIAFFRPNDASFDLIVRSLDDGSEGFYSIDRLSQVSARWLHDDSGLLVFINRDRGGSGEPLGYYHRLDLRQKRFVRLLPKDIEGRVRTAVAELASDDDTLYQAERAAGATRWERIVAVSLTSGQARTVLALPAEGYEAPGGVGLALGPDGRTLALMGMHDRQRRLASIATVDVDGSGYRVVHGPFEVDGVADLIRWTPDGRHLVFVTTAIDGSWRIMQVPREGGEAVFTGLGSRELAADPSLPPLRARGAYNISLHPDGSRIIFGAPSLPTFELWAVNDLLNVIAAR